MPRTWPSAPRSWLAASRSQQAGVVVVRRLRGRWFSALRILAGDRRTEERLDSEQKSVTRTVRHGAPESRGSNPPAAKPDP